VLRGNPTPEELAAALTVVHARAAAAATTPTTGQPTPRDSWSDPSRIAARRLPHPGPTSWNRTYWPG
ncbi:acyl-CoA carboxylase subunit epsilon, partial [Streptomyces sp. MS06]|uniref:acyl-CoA carboxylase subunit epsilon n=1 Tax=Streptomyces sp. MS06 TaxID=3385974 RepID=UPI0039A1152F